MHVVVPYLTSLQAWLAHQLSRIDDAMEGKVLIDVGAYQGTFTKGVLSHVAFGEAVLFEPHPDNVHVLETTCATDDRIRIEAMALGHETADVSLYCTADRATGSVLPYIRAGAMPVDEVTRYPIRQTTLDHYLAQHPELGPVGLVKIDTQGYDGHVLRGAVQTLREHSPWLVVECIFGALYQNQARPMALFNWLYDHEYTLAALFNEHYAKGGWLAFADAVFVPRTLALRYEAPYTTLPDLTSLQEKVRSLEAVCAERLDLITFLHQEAARRLEIIQHLQKQLETKK